MPEAPPGYCYHVERIDNKTNIGVCTICGRTVQYNRENPLLPPEVIIPGLPLPPREKPGRKYESNTWPRVPKEVTVVETVQKEITPKDQEWFDLSDEERNEYFDRHKEELTEDLRELTYKQMEEKWGLKTYQVSALKKLFDMPIRIYKTNKRKKSAAGNPGDAGPKDPGDGQDKGQGAKAPARAVTSGTLNKKLQEIKERLEDQGQRLEELEEQATKDRPPFPAFNEAWGDEVKVAWINARSQM